MVVSQLCEDVREQVVLEKSCLPFSVCRLTKPVKDAVEDNPDVGVRDVKVAEVSE